MKKVRMYSLSTCPWCMKAKRFFKEHKIPLELFDYDLVSDADQKKIREELDGYGVERTFPIVFIGKEVISGYEIDRWKELLDL